MRFVKKTALESSIVKKVLAWMFSHAPQMIPIKKLRETPGWLAFCHPAPSYPVHIVIIPKKPWKDWLELDANDPVAIKEFVELTQMMIRDFELTPAGYRLIMNGGANQTFPHLHFHLVAGDPF
jgi:histidine triad (HIT) family protein